MEFKDRIGIIFKRRSWGMELIMWLVRIKFIGGDFKLCFFKFLCSDDRKKGVDYGFDFN